MENFLAQLKDAGSELEFVFKKTAADEKDFLRRRLRDYHMGCEIIKTIESVPSFEKLLELFNDEEKFPYNTMIQVALIQSAKKFGTVHGCNTLKGKPTVQVVDLAKKKDADWIMGLDTIAFVMPGKWKIWCDSKLDMEAMTIQELDPNIVMAHFQLKPEQGPLFASLAGDFQAKNSWIKTKVYQHFGKSKFENAAKFVRNIKATSTDDMIQETIEKIFGRKADPIINKELKKSLKSFEINNEVVSKVDKEILEMVQDDFMSIAEEILLNMPIFIFPAYLDMRKKDMKTINELVLPIILKTAGIILKSLDDSNPRKIILIKSHDKAFSSEPAEICFPDFDIPPLKTIIAGEMSSVEKMEFLYWILGMEIQKSDMMTVSQEYLVDCMILLYALKHKSIRVIDARCILKTLVDARRRTVPLEYSTEYPETINERGFRCSFLYSKLFFFIHSCLSSLGMKDMCPDIQFDGVYFQKIYNLNVQDGQTVNEEDKVNNKEAPADKKKESPDDNQEAKKEDEEDFEPSILIEEFVAIIRE